MPRTTKSVDVKSARKAADGKRAVVAAAELEFFDTLAEFVEAKGEKRTLELALTQNNTNIKNQARAAAVGEPSEKALQNEAFMRIAMAAPGTSLSTQAQACAGDPTRFADFVQSVVDTIKAERGIVDDEEDSTAAA